MTNRHSLARVAIHSQAPATVHPWIACPADEPKTAPDADNVG